MGKWRGFCEICPMDVPRMTKIIFLPLLFVGVLLVGWKAPGKPMKGQLWAAAGIFDNQEAKPLCRLDSAETFVMEIDQAHENPLFESKDENRVHLFLQFAQKPQKGKRYNLPSEEVQLCYWEKGDLLMFKSFSGLGWVEFNSVEKGKASGKMDLKIVKPHHNMSNSDYHYMGGEFRLKVSDFKGKSKKE